jgi:hypothetical protein
LKTIILIIFTIFFVANISFSQNGWYVAANNIGSYLTCISFADPNNGWIGSAGGNNELYKSTDGGTTWISFPRVEPMFPKGICFNDSAHGYVASGPYPNGAALYPVWLTTDDGAYWRQIAYNNYYGADFHSVTFFNSGMWYCGTLTPFGIPSVTHSFIGPRGGELLLGNSTSLYRIRAGINDPWSVGDSGLVYRTYTFCGVGNPSVNLTGVSFQDVNTGYVVGGNFMYKSTNNGGSWNRIYPLTPSGA